MAAARPALPIRLYGTALSGHTHRVHLFLSLLQIPFEVIDIDLAKKEQKSPGFLAKNPFGQVPVIEDGDVTLYDSNAILVYLATRYDDGRWLPRDPVGMAKVQLWLSLAAGPILHGPGLARLANVFGATVDRARAAGTAEKLFRILNSELEGRRFALGDDPSLADVAAYAYIAHAPEGGISLEPYPNLRAWLRHIEALPHFVPMPASTAGLSAG